MLDRIPYEIFSNIIKIAYQRFSVTAYAIDDIGPSIPPIEASHVCHSWRVALLSNPTMWTCIIPKFHGRDSDKLREMFSRSGSAPLDVFMEELGYDPTQSQSTSLITTLPLVFREIHRFRRLYIEIPEIFSPEMSRHLKQPAPMLQYFHFDLSQSHVQDLSDTFRKAYQDLLLGNAPSLRHVHLKISAGFGELESTSLFKNLSTLHLAFASHTDIDGDILLDILRSSPCLRTLNLVIPYLRSMIVCSAPLHHHVFLPYLQKLRLRGVFVASNIDFILGRIKFPFDKVRFDIQCEDIDDSEFLPLFLSQRRLPLLSSSLYDMTIDLYENIDLNSPASHSDESSVLSIPYDSSEPLDILPGLRTLKLSDITHVHLEMIPSGSAVLRRILPLLENLLHLRVIHGFLEEPEEPEDAFDAFDAFDVSSVPGSSFLKALAPPRLRRSIPQIEASSESDTDSDIDSIDNDPSDEATSPRRAFPCPSLHMLEIVFTPGFDFKQFAERYFEKLARCSKLRGQIGHPIKYISIRSEPPALVDNMKTWFQDNEFDWSRIEFV